MIFGYAPASEPVLARLSDVTPLARSRSLSWPMTLTLILTTPYPDVKPVTRTLSWGGMNKPDLVGKPTTTLTLALTLGVAVALGLALSLSQPTPEPKPEP